MTWHNLTQAAAWTLVHFIWQGAIIALALAFALRLLRDASSNARYMASCAALALALCAPAATWLQMTNASPFALKEKTNVGAPALDARLAAKSLATDAQPVRFSHTADSSSAATNFAIRQRIENFVNNCAPYLLLAWLTGALFLLARLVGGWAQANKLKRNIEASAKMREVRLAQASNKFGLPQRVRVGESSLVESPSVIGFLRPLVVIPSQAAARLDARQLNAVLAHELAHVKRGDYLFNLAQSFAEAALFYHPAARWMSKRIRIEREHACDDAAVAACDGDALFYARALMNVEEMRAGAPATGLAMAADGGGTLFARIRRIISNAPNRAPMPSRLATAACAALLASSCAMNLLLLEKANAQSFIKTSAASDFQTASNNSSALYQTMTKQEQSIFVAKQAREIARCMTGGSGYEFTLEFEAEIQKSVDFYANRIGNNGGGDRLGVGDLKFVFARGEALAPKLMKSFERRNVSPLIGLYIPLVESEYVNIETPNGLGALGMFQFLPQTGVRFGLTQAELLDVDKSADAAARYIAQNLTRFSNDPMKETLAILSYNRGEGAVERDIAFIINDKNRQCSICALTAARARLDQTFREENVYYVPRFFAAAIIGENPQAFGIQARPLSSYKTER